MPETPLHGRSLVAGRLDEGTSLAHRVLSRLTGEGLEPEFLEASASGLEQACLAAREAASSFGDQDQARAELLDRIAEGIEGLGDRLLERASHETALPMARLTGERARTCNQLRMFARLVREGGWRDVRIDLADPDRPGVPKPELRRMLVPIGPVAVFGASNFPLAFSVAGGDTASALAAGCPVIVKAHPAHPGTSEMVGQAITDAISAIGFPAGAFSMLHGGPEVGQALVIRPEVCGVAFTGSYRAGKALFDLANSRTRPIPVFAEMGSVNPVFLMPSALDHSADQIAAGYADSLTLGVGQFCTNPGVVVGVRSDSFNRFARRATELLKEKPQGVMLTQAICDAYCSGVADLGAVAGVEVLLAGEGSRPALFKASAETFLREPRLREEVFGPAAVLVECADEREFEAVAEAIEGQLTATVHFDPGDHALVRELLLVLERVAGRIVANGFPTGVEVSPAMQHGGPWPATTDARFTSVGTASIARFLRPVAYQGFPSELLPAPLR